MQRSYDKPTNFSWAARGISEEAVINLPAVENLHRNIHSAPQVSTTTSYKHCSNIRSPYRVPNDLNVVQWTLFKQSLLMQTLRDAFSAFAPTYGSMFKMLDYKLDISRNQNLPFNSRMLTALAFLPTKDVRGFVAVCTEIRILVMLPTNCWPTLRTSILAIFALILREIIQYFQKNFRTCFIALMPSFHEPIIAWRLAS